MSPVGLAALDEALCDPVVLARYRVKITGGAGSECLWWTGRGSGLHLTEGSDGGVLGRFTCAREPVKITHGSRSR